MGDYMDDEDTSQESNKQPTIKINNTRFIFKTNFSGDPRRDKYGSSKRHANLVIPDASLAQDLILEGFNVKTIYGKNKDGSSSGVPTFYVDAKVNYNYSHPPLIYLVTGDNKDKSQSITVIDQQLLRALELIFRQHMALCHFCKYTFSCSVFLFLKGQLIRLSFLRGKNWKIKNCCNV